LTRIFDFDVSCRVDLRRMRNIMNIKKFIDDIATSCIAVAMLTYAIFYPIFTLSASNPGRLTSKVASFFVGVTLLIQAIFAKTDALRMLLITGGLAFLASAIFLDLHIVVFGFILIFTFFVLKAFTDYMDYTVETYHKIKKELDK
jgi:hypothetical protein